MLIRELQPEDLPRLIELCAEHADYECLEYHDKGQLQQLAGAVFGAPKKLFVWVIATAEGELQGYMSATLDYSTWSAAQYVYMDCLYLTEPYRGAGWGRGLLKTLTSFADSVGCENIQWQTPPDNELGIGFYQRIGASQLPKQRFSLNKAVQSWPC